MKKYVLLLFAFLMYSESTHAQCSITLDGDNPPFFVCESELPLELLGFPDGGNFSNTLGTIPDQNLSGQAIFNPVAGEGIYTVTYTAPDGTECSETIQVLGTDLTAELTTPNPNFASQLQFCANEEDTVFLAGNLDPNPNAYFLIDDLAAIYFIPSQMGDGIHIIEYIYLDQTTGCTSTDEAIIFINTPPDLSMDDNLLPAYCVASTPVTLSAYENSTFAGNGVNSFGIFDPTVVGIGTHEVTHYYNSNICSDSLVFTIEVVDVIVLGFESRGPSCYTEIDTIVYSGDGAGEDATYDWIVEDGQIIEHLGDSILVEWETAGDHLVSLEISDILCPSSPLELTITKQSLEVETSPDDVVDRFGQIEIAASATASFDTEISYEWSPSETLVCDSCATTIAVPDETTTYTVTATTPDGCSATSEVTITVVDDRNVFVPNIFTPNEDGKNDELHVLGKGISEIDWAIYDRWGAKVFQTNDTQGGWDGSFKGKKMNAGVFVYALQVTFYDGQVQKYTGNVTLIR